MKRSTNTAPVSLSTSYLIGSPCIGISMTTLQSLGMSRPAGTRSRLMCGGPDVLACNYTQACLARAGYPSTASLRTPSDPHGHDHRQSCLLYTSPSPRD